MMQDLDPIPQHGQGSMFAKTLATPGDRGSFGVRIQGRGFSIAINEELGFGEQTRGIGGGE